MTKTSKRRRVYTKRTHRRHRRIRLYNPFTSNYVLDALSKGRPGINDVDNIRQRIKALIENDLFWDDVKIAVEAQKRIKEVEI